MHTGSPAHARACCPGVVSSLKGRKLGSLAKRSVRKDGSCRGSGCRAQRRRRFTPTTVAASTSLSTRKVTRYPELTRGEPQGLVVFAAKVEGRWCDDCQQFLRTLLRLRVHRAPPPCAPLQPRVGRAAGGVCCRLPCREPSPAPRLKSGPCRRCLVGQTRSRLGDVLDLAIGSAPSRLPLR